MSATTTSTGSPRRPATRAARRSDARAHAHPAWWAFLVHRLSGLGLALFLPLHFWVLGEALGGEAALERSIRFVDQPLFKVAEWGLVVLLSLHLVGGVRLLLIEFGPWTGVRKNWIAAAVGISVAIGMAFALALIT